MRVRHSQATTVEVCPETVEVLEFDLTRADTDEYTESFGREPTLLFTSETVEVDVDGTRSCSGQPGGQGSFGFVGATPVGADLLRGIRQQKWSPVDVLLWAAARGDESTPVLDWLRERAHFIDGAIQFHGGHTKPSVALTTAWAALREVMRSWGIRAREDLSDWLGQLGFLRSSPRTSDPRGVPQRRQSCIVRNRLRGDCPPFGKVNNAKNVHDAPEPSNNPIFQDTMGKPRLVFAIVITQRATNQYRFRPLEENVSFCCAGASFFQSSVTLVLSPDFETRSLLGAQERSNTVGQGKQRTQTETANNPIA